MIRERIFFDLIGNVIVPKRIKRHLRAYLLKAGITKVPYEKFGLLFCLVIILNLASYSMVYLFFLNRRILYVLSYAIKPNVFLLLTATIVYLAVGIVIGAVLFGFLAKFYFDIRIYKRTKKIEEILPNFLESVNVNLKAGMTFDKALWNSVEEGFGVLEKEIEIVAKKEMSGEDITKALGELRDKYDSPLLNESLNLIIVGIEEGADITDVIEELVKNIKETTFLRKQAVANVMNYIFFIAIIATVISPVLFAFSYNLLIILKSIGSKITSSAGPLKIAVPSFIGEILFDVNNFVVFSRLCILAISTASTFIIINLIKGSLKEGVKYVPIFVLVSLLIYELSLHFLKIIFKFMF